jgi:hypothetical protein
MQDWNYTPEHPINLTLCADARLSPTDTFNDQIWELSIGNSEPPAISFQTTFGLRARLCRIFPRFILDSKIINNPAEFHHPITIHQYFPNYLKLSFKPFMSINVCIEYWVPNSQTIAGRTRVLNTGHATRQLQIDWAELLIPGAEGHRMALQEMGLIPILAGETADLVPVFLLSGGNRSGKSPYPSLSVAFSLPPQGENASHWVHASLADLRTSFESAKTAMDKNWDAEFARIRRVNSENMEVITGNHDWNTALFLSQVRASQLVLNSKSSDSPPFLVNQRSPDQGFSSLKDSNDFSRVWNLPSILDIYYLVNFIFPSSREILHGLLDKFFTTQLPEGEINLIPRQGDRRYQILATPLFSSLTWQLYECDGDIELLKHAFPHLFSFFFSWFTEAHDRDHDLIPEWDLAIQTGFETNPHFSYVNSEALGIDISTVESPDLCAFLFRECQSLIMIAREIGEHVMLPRLETMANKLRVEINQFWDDEHASYLFRDRDSHTSAPMEVLGNLQGSGIIDIHQGFQPPVRPVIKIKSKKESTHPAQIYIHGTLPTGVHRVEHILSMQGHWQLGSGYFTSQNIYEEIEHIEVMGAILDDVITVFTSGHIGTDQTNLLPLWAGLASAEKAKILVNLSIMNKNKYLSPYGLRSYIDIRDTGVIADEFNRISWSSANLVLEGLVRYKERKNAVEIFSRSMKSVIQGLKTNLNFYRFYHSETGLPIAPINSLTSLVPIGLFLQIAGVNIISPTKVKIMSHNPFPWPVSIKYRGLTVVHQEKKTIIIFPNGQNTTVDNSHAQTVSLEE